jgi:hypothetical protein
MPYVRAILLAATILLLTRTAAVAQQQVHFTRAEILRPDAVEDRVIVDSVRSDLAHVRAAQEAYYAANQTYASELGDLENVKLSPGTTVVILSSSPDGWEAEATHPSLQGAEVVRVAREEKAGQGP